MCWCGPHYDMFVLYDHTGCLQRNIFILRMKTSWYGHTLHITNPLCGDSTGHWWFLHTKSLQCGPLMFALLLACTKSCQSFETPWHLYNVTVTYDYTLTRTIGDNNEDPTIIYQYWNYCIYAKLKVTSLSMQIFMRIEIYPRPKDSIARFDLVVWSQIACLLFWHIRFNQWTVRFGNLDFGNWI